MLTCGLLRKHEMKEKNVVNKPDEKKDTNQVSIHHQGFHVQFFNHGREPPILQADYLSQIQIQMRILI